MNDQAPNQRPVTISVSPVTTTASLIQKSARTMLRALRRVIPWLMAGVAIWVGFCAVGYYFEQKHLASLEVPKSFPITKTPRKDLDVHVVTRYMHGGVNYRIEIVGSSTELVGLLMELDNANADLNAAWITRDSPSSENWIVKLNFTDDSKFQIFDIPVRELSPMVDTNDKVVGITAEGWSRVWSEKSYESAVRCSTMIRTSTR